MKKLILCTLTLFLILITSCTNNEIVSENTSDANFEYNTTRSSESILPIVVSHEGIATLKFRNEDQMHNLAKFLHPYTMEERVYKISSLGVKSFYESYKAIQKELDQLTNNLENVNFWSEYETIKQNSAAYAIYQDSVLYPECRAKSLNEALFSNSKGFYFIGDSLCKIQLYNEISERQNDPNVSRLTLDATDEIGFRSNKIYKKTFDRLVIMELLQDPIGKTLSVKFHSQKRRKIMFVNIWNVQNAIFYARITIHELSKPFKVAHSLMANKMLEESGGTVKKPAPFTLYPNASQIVYITTQNAYEMIFGLGYFELTSNPNNPIYGISNVMKGKMEAWTNNICYEDRGIDEIDINMPQ